MKTFFCAIVVFIGTAVICGAEGIVEQARIGEEKTEMSYAFGMVVAADLKETGLDFNYSSFMRGFRDVMLREQTRYTQDEAMDIIQTAFQAAMAETGERNRAAGAAFLAENAKRPGVVTSPSGLQFELISAGNGEKPGPSDNVLVHYRGTTIDGTVFDSTERGGPAEIPLYGVIPGFSEGLQMMGVGDKARLFIPPELAYGDRGAGSTIGPNTLLVFDVELLAITAGPGGEEGDDGESDF